MKKDFLEELYMISSFKDGEAEKIKKQIFPLHGFLK
jgi:hypothetical protein